MKRVLIAADVDPRLIELLGSDERFLVRVRPCVTEEELRTEVGDAEVLVTRHHNRVTSRVIESAASLELIAQGTSGTDNIAAEAAAARGVAVISTPGENAAAVAEIVLSHMISLARTVPAYHRAMLAGVWHRDDCASRRELRSLRLGIVGLGRVGTLVAKRAHAFGMEIGAYDPYIASSRFEEETVTSAATLEELLGRSDVLTLHVPLTHETRGMIDGTALSLLPASAIVINCSRGAVLDVDAALDALASDRLFGLALDVFPEEPPAGSSWPDDPRLILTPHIAGCSRESKASIGEALYRAILGHFGYAE